MNNNNKVFGKLFNSIELNSEEHLDAIIQTLNKESALYFLIQSVKFAYQNGVYSMGEVEVISKSIRILLKQKESVEQSEN